MKQVTVKKAREILGNNAKKISDEELQKLIDDLSAIARWTLEKLKTEK